MDPLAIFMQIIAGTAVLFAAVAAVAVLVSGNKE
jgi:hypothetical protein